MHALFGGLLPGTELLFRSLPAEPSRGQLRARAPCHCAETLSDFSSPCGPWGIWRPMESGGIVCCADKA